MASNKRSLDDARGRYSPALARKRPTTAAEPYGDPRFLSYGTATRAW